MTREVKETKIPTTKQMNNIACNLREVFDCHAQVQISVDAYDHHSISEDAKVVYQIYTSKRFNKEAVRNFNSWKDLMDFYKKLISS